MRGAAWPDDDNPSVCSIPSSSRLSSPAASRHFGQTPTGASEGRYFPHFVDNEDRLYELDDIEKWVDSVDSVILESIDRFRYRRQSTLKELLKQANCRHYSTFCLYNDDEFKDALKSFEENVRQNYDNINQVEWNDENIMLTLRAG